MATLTARLEASRMRRIGRSRWFRISTRLVVGGGVLIAVVAHVGTAPFLHGLLSIDARSIGAAMLLAFVATMAAAWRWRVIAGRLGVGLRWSNAIGMYYRSQFLNSVLPGGVAGDLHRAISHGRSSESLGQASRSVVIERISGQIVQLALALVVLASLQARFAGYLLTVLAISTTSLAVVVLVAFAVSRRVRRAVHHELNELRAGLGSVAAAVQVAIASIVVIGCHAATFVVATTALGESIPPVRLLTLALVILLGASIPLNVGGWGPREGIAGWAFALAGFGAAAGVAASTLFGVLVFISVAPGAIITVIAAARRHRSLGMAGASPSPTEATQQPIAVRADQHQEESS